MIFTLIQQAAGEVEIPGTLLSHLLILISIILVVVILRWVYHKWIVPPKVKESKEYERDKYRDIDGC